MRISREDESKRRCHLDLDTSRRITKTCGDSPCKEDEGGAEKEEDDDPCAGMLENIGSPIKICRKENKRKAKKITEKKKGKN